VYYPCAQTNDLSGNTVVVPASHMMLRTYLYNDQVSYQWFAPAGVHRGLISNVNDIGYVDINSGEFVHNSINQGLRDALYQTNINPITLLPGVGIVCWGQKTRNPVTSAMDRVNVARLVNYLRTIFAHVGYGFLFEPNDTPTRKQIANIISSSLNNLVALRGLYDYLVVCDDSNNTPDRIAQNQLYVDVAIEPMKDVEFVYIPIALYNPGGIAALGK
jgi:Phage tail sheath C-terminal domain